LLLLKRQQAAHAQLCGMPAKQSASRLTVLHWNILASYLGKNTNPWFLHGLNLSAARRAAIVTQYYARDPATHSLLHRGWPSYVAGVLSDEEQRTVLKVDKECFLWPSRFEKIHGVLLEASADIVSIVELDQYEALKQRLAEYDSAFVRRPRPISTDGSALFWKRDRFEVLGTRSVTFVDRHDPEAVLDRCAVCALLQLRSNPAHRFIVVSMHLARETSEPGGLLRARQLATLAKTLREFCSDTGDCLETTPVVVCGDVNETFLQRLQGLVAVGAILSGTMLHPFVFSSQAVRLDGPTSRTEARTVTVDAVLYSASVLDAEQVKLDCEQRSTGPLPDQFTPSDHFPIMVSLGIKPPTQQGADAAVRWWSAVAAGVHVVTGAHSEEHFLGPIELAQAFSQVDVDGDGVVSASDAASSVQRLGLFGALAEARRASILRHASPPLTFAEFCGKFYASQPFSTSLTRAAFEAIDSSPKDGDVSLKELVAFFEPFVKTPLHADAQALLSNADMLGLASKSGGLELQSFQTFLGTKFVELVFDKDMAAKVIQAMKRALV
jgi:endonuclease/exonuclease/phosphatase family metal-dependent hydrolase/Ca2+-binding EF-hand superfamily protein